jgi:hypothetical protein
MKPTSQELGSIRTGVANVVSLTKGTVNSDFAEVFFLYSFTNLIYK